MSSPRTERMEMLLSPRSVAIVGASDRGDKPGARLTKALAGSRFEGRIFGVNPRALALERIEWVPSVAELPVTPDLACIALSADGAVEAFADLCDRGTRAVIMFSSGFAESGEEGRRREARLVELATAHGVALCGPNTAGVFDAATGFVGTFTHALIDGDPPAGNVMVVTQSGAVGGILITHLRDRNVGISRWISVGNGSVLDVSDYLAFAAEDPATRVVLLFLEGVVDGSEFLRAAARCRQAGKIVIAFKAGRSALGARAAASHTGKLAGSQSVYAGAFEQVGIVQAHSVRQLTDLAQFASWIGRDVGRRGAIASISGAGCTVLADEMASAGLELAPLRAGTRDRLGEVLPGFSQHDNPVDLTGVVLEDTRRLTAVLSALAEDPSVDFTVISFATNNRRDIADAVIEAWDGRTPLAAVLPVAAPAATVMHGRLTEAHVPTFRDMADAIATVAKLAVPGRPPEPAAQEPGTSTNQDSCWMTSAEALSLIADEGLPVVRSAPAESAENAVLVAATMGERVVVKVDHPRVLHKTDIGGVRIVARAEVAAACRAIEDAVQVSGVTFAPDGGFSVQELVPEGTEVIVGLTTDTTFGRVITIGVGGTLVEIVRQVACRVMPMTDVDARRAIEETALGELLRNSRLGPRDVDALVDVIMGFQRFAAGQPYIEEAELNPVIVGAAGQGCRIVDARMRTARATIRGAG
jgi:acetate---CoA ligase (ADP-forming)